MKNFISELDTNRFGFRVAKINTFNENLENEIIDLKNLGVKLIISRVKCNDINLINKLEDLNFRIKDTQLTFLHDMKNMEEYFSEINNKNDIVIELATVDDVEAVGKIASQSFQGYGHYAANKGLNKKKINEIYVDWAQKSCIDKKVADYMFVAKIKNRIGGFLSLKIVNDDEFIYGVQHLGAVDKEFRNMDIFRLLIKKCLIIGKEKNHNWQQTYLLSTNIPVIRSYLKIGFKISDSNHTMHCWI